MHPRRPAAHGPDDAQVGAADLSELGGTFLVQQLRSPARLRGLGLVFAAWALAALVGCGSPPAKRVETSGASPRELRTRFGDLDDKTKADACAELRAVASMQFAETPDGARLHLAPRGDRDAMVTRAVAVEHLFLPGVRGAGPNACSALASLESVTVRLSEGTDGLSLIFETFEAGDVAKVRTQVKAFASKE